MGDQLLIHMVRDCKECEVVAAGEGHENMSDIFTTGHFTLLQRDDRGRGGNLMGSLHNNIHNVIADIHLITHQENTGTYAGTQANNLPIIKLVLLEPTAPASCGALNQN